MNVAPTSPHRFDHDGTTYFFCSAGCLAKFRADPARYLSGKAHEPMQVIGIVRPQKSKGATPAASSAPRAPGAPGATPGEWTCPMHPEVVRDGPGSCPICGMALERRTLTAAALEDNAEENPELRDMTRRFWLAAVLTLPL